MFIPESEMMGTCYNAFCMNYNISIKCNIFKNIKVILQPVLGEENFSLKIQYGMPTAVSLLSYSCMVQVEICSQQLEICKSVCMFIVLAIVVEID